MSYRFSVDPTPFPLIQSASSTNNSPSSQAQFVQPLNPAREYLSRHATPICSGQAIERWRKHPWQPSGYASRWGTRIQLQSICNMRLFQFSSVTGSPLPITRNTLHLSLIICLPSGKPSHRG